VSLSVAAEVRRRAGDCCEYCRIPEATFQRSFHIEHIVARQHGGSSELGNLALACWLCNLKKGPNLTGVDPETGQVTALFHPRHDLWSAHFVVRLGQSSDPKIEIRGKTAIGRTTVIVLGMNAEMRPMLRYALWQEGKYAVPS
jgi:hypothetical protein